MESQATTPSPIPIWPLVAGLGWLHVSSFLPLPCLSPNPRKTQGTLDSLTCHLPGLLAGFSGESGPCGRSPTCSVDKVAPSLTACPEPGARDTSVKTPGPPGPQLPLWLLWPACRARPHVPLGLEPTGHPASMGSSEVQTTQKRGAETRGLLPDRVAPVHAPPMGTPMKGDGIHDKGIDGLVFLRTCHPWVDSSPEPANDGSEHELVTTEGRRLAVMTFARRRGLGSFFESFKAFFLS